MKPSIIIIAGLVYILATCSCKKAEELRYTSEDNVYFDLVEPQTNTRMDSIVYSFALFPEKSADTVYLPVKLSGNRTSAERTFRISVVDSATTATAGLHYQPMQDSYSIPAGAGSVQVPVVLFNTDTALMSKTVRIKFLLEGTADLHADYKHWDTVRVIFSNRLEKPLWWDTWVGEVGPYSRVKHELFIRTSGTTELPPNISDGSIIPRVLYYTRRFRSFLNDPLQWVQDYPDEGYAVEPAGSNAYYFYSITNPEKKYLMQLNPADNKYYFTDENGNRIV